MCICVFDNGLTMNYTGGPKQLLDNTHSLTVRYVRLETSLYSQTSVHERLESWTIRFKNKFSKHKASRMMYYDSSYEYASRQHWGAISWEYQRRQYSCTKTNQNGQLFIEPEAQWVWSRVEWCQETEKRKRIPFQTTFHFLTTFHLCRQLSFIQVR